MYRFATNEGLDLDELRARLRKMTDEQLVRFGKAARVSGAEPTAREGGVDPAIRQSNRWVKGSSLERRIQRIISKAVFA